MWHNLQRIYTEQRRNDYDTLAEIQTVEREEHDTLDVK
mgnify:CR=1 FL=1